MRPIKNTTELIGIKDQNIKISLVFETDTHIEIQAKLDYPAPSCPHCQGKMIKYDFQKTSKIPLLEQAGTPTLLRLKKRRFQCKSCRRVTVAETSIVEKNCQISNLVRQKVQFITMDMSGAYIPLAKRLFPNAKLEATNKLIKDIKRLGFGFRNFINFKKRVFITLNIKKGLYNFCSG